jgi:CDP-diacylglycerol--glycerol-3-phosphate 3-phosphatidyltransferase
MLAVAWRLCQSVFAQNWILIPLILFSEAAVILVSYARFGKYPATHSYLAKFYGLCLLAALTSLLCFNAGSWAVIALTIVALATNLEIIAIHFLMDCPPVDGRSIFAMPKRQNAAAK